MLYAPPDLPPKKLPEVCEVYLRAMLFLRTRVHVRMSAYVCSLRCVFFCICPGSVYIVGMCLCVCMWICVSVGMCRCGYAPKWVCVYVWVCAYVDM